MIAPHRKGLLIGLLGVLVLTPDSLLIRLVDTDPLTMSGLRGLLSGLTLLAWFTLVDRASPVRRLRELGRVGLLVSAMFAANSVLFVHAIHYTYVANALLLISSTPLFAALGSLVFLREPVSRPTWIAITVVLSAMLLLFAGSLGSGNLWGDLSALATACLMAAIFVVVRARGALNMVPCVALGGLIVAILTAPFADPLTLDGQQWVMVLTLGCVILPVSFGLLVLAPRWLPAAEVSLLLLLETLLGPLWVWLVLDEQPGWQTLTAGVVILLTLVYHGVATEKVRNLH